MDCLNCKNKNTAKCPLVNTNLKLEISDVCKYRDIIESSNEKSTQDNKTTINKELNTNRSK